LYRQWSVVDLLSASTDRYSWAFCQIDWAGSSLRESVVFRAGSIEIVITIVKQS
jgi:hypothetical protein